MYYYAYYEIDYYIVYITKLIVDYKLINIKI